MAICGDFQRVFVVGPVFRAEDSYTHRHLCEFTGLDVEMEIKGHYSEVMDIVDSLFVDMFNKINEECKEAIRKQYPFKDLKFMPLIVAGCIHFSSTLEQSLKSGKKHALHATSVTNVCVGLLSGLKAILTLRSQPFEMEILNAVQGIFQSVLVEGGICESQRRASSDRLGLLARLGNDMFTEGCFLDEKSEVLCNGSSEDLSLVCS
ncbi:protein SWEETIE isoform X1 [Tanacetum coccineum]